MCQVKVKTFAFAGTCIIVDIGGLFNNINILHKNYGVNISLNLFSIPNDSIDEYKVLFSRFCQDSRDFSRSCDDSIFSIELVLELSTSRKNTCRKVLSSNVSALIEKIGALCNWVK
jgi:hypothetical protein